MPQPDAIAAPQDVVTIAFTGVVDSVQLWEANPTAMQKAHVLHHAVIRECLTKHRGYEVKTEGDAFMVAFADPTDAVRWAMAVQYALYQAQWPATLSNHPAAATAPDFRGLRVRIGIHTGRPECRPDPHTGVMDYFGPAVNRAARIQGAAHGGQVLISGTIWGAVHEVLENTTFKPLGEHHLKGMDQAVRLIEVTPETLQQRRFPPPNTLDARKTNLQTFDNLFVGRSKELDIIDSLFARGDRLVTILGTAGIGKTRLANHYGQVRLHEYSPVGGGVWFANLTEATDAAGICQCIAESLQIPLTLGNSTDASIGQLERALDARGRVLLILDNFDRLLPHASATVGRWLARAPQARFLVTSRERLKIRGEVGLDMAPVPAVEAMELLVSRAGLNLSEEDVPALHHVVQQLDCLPLAIELAAPLIKQLTLPTLLNQLSTNNGFKVLEGHQATLRSAIDRSWDLLNPWERDAWAQCAIFRGGFSLEAASEIIDLSNHDDAPWVLDVIGTLRDKSLLRTMPTPGLPDETRFAMYESIRDYCLEKLQEQGRIAAAQQRYVLWFCEHAESLSREVDAGNSDSLRALSLEVDNLVQAHHWAKGNSPEAAVRIALALDPALSVRGPISTHLQLLDGAVEASRNLAPGWQASCLLHRGIARRAARQMNEAATDLQAALQAARSVKAHALGAHALAEMGYLRRWQGQMSEAEQLQRRATDLFSEIRDRRGIGITRLNLALLFHEQGRTDEAEARYLEALSLFREVGDRRRAGIALGNLGRLHLVQGRTTEAGNAYTEALNIHRDFGSRVSEGYALANLGIIEHQQGNLEVATQQYTAAYGLFREVGNQRAQGFVQGFLAALQADRDNPEEATNTLQQAKNHLDILRDAQTLMVLELAAGHIDLAMARTADPPLRQQHVERAKERLSRIDEAASEQSALRSSDVRVAAQLLQRALRLG